MATIVNAMDVFLQGQSPRLEPTSENYILLNVSSPVFKLLDGITTPTSIVINAVPMGSLSGTVSFSTSPTISMDIVGNIATIPSANMLTYNEVVITATLSYLGSTYTKSTTINRLESSTLIIGDLTNQSHALSSNYDGTGVVLTGPEDGGTFRVYRGSVEILSGVTYSIQSSTSSDATKVYLTKPSGLVMELNKTTGVYNLTGSWDNSTEVETFSLIAEYLGSTSIKVFTVTKVKTGTPGQFLYIDAATVFNKASLTATTSVPASSLIKGKLNTNGVVTDWGWVTTTPFTTVLGTESARVPSSTGITYTPSGTGITKIVVNLYSLASGGVLAETEEIPIVFDGTDGTNATNPVVGDLTNQAHIVSALADGTGYTTTGAGGTFKVYSGATEVTGSATFAVTAPATKNGLTMSINSSGVYTLTGGSWATDTESFILTAIYAGTTVTKSYTITKAKIGVSGAYAYIDSTTVVFAKAAADASTSGAYTPASSIIKGKLNASGTVTDWGWVTTTPSNGGESARVSSSIGITYVPASTVETSVTIKLYNAASAGDLIDTEVVPIVFKGNTGATGTGVPGADGDKTATGYLYYGTASATTPSTPTASSYNFNTHNFATLTGNWSTTPVTADPVSGSKFWACRYTVTKPALSGEVVTITTPFNWTNFTGLVTFANQNSSFSSYVTSIDGSKINTGSIVLSAGTLQTIKTGTKTYEAAEAGIFLGNVGGLYKFDIGDSSNYLRWNGSALTVSGIINTPNYVVAGGVWPGAQANTMPAGTFSGQSAAGVYATTTGSTTKPAIWGENLNTASGSSGVRGWGRTGVEGYATANGGTGVRGTATGNSSYPGSTGVYGINPDMDYGWGVYCQGRLGVSWQLVSSVSSGTAPFVISSNTQVTNLNASLLEGHPSSYFLAASQAGNHFHTLGGITTDPGWYAFLVSTSPDGSNAVTYYFKR